MKLTVLDNPADVSHALASRVAAAVRANPAIVLGLATGRTPVHAYGEIRRMYAEGHVDWGIATTFNLDEFVGIDAADPGSFRQFMQRHLFDGINLNPSRIHFLNGAASDLAGECQRFEDAIVAAGGIDVQILGIGANGHIGFNEPGDDLIARTHCVTLLDSTRQNNAALFGGKLASVPRQALTMGVGTILRATRILLVAVGESKAEAIRRTVAGRITTQLPASFLQLHADVELLLDRAAAEGL